MSMNSIIRMGWAGAGLAAGVACFAQQGPEVPTPATRFGLSYRAGFNVKARFADVGGFARRTDPGAAIGGGLDRNYDDGYNRVDSSGNAGGLTWNWGYNDPGQIPGNDTVVLHSSTSGSIATATDGDPQHGLELSFNHRLGHIAGCAWGIEAAFNYTDLSARQSGSLGATVSRLGDAYALGGVLPPVAPYAGTFGNAGPMIGDAPTRTIETVANGATIDGARSLEGTIYGWRLGPYLDIRLAQRLRLSLSAGLALAVVDSEFRFDETVTIPTVGVDRRMGAGGESDLLVGVFAGGTLAYDLSQAVSVFVGAQYQNLGRFEQSAAGKQAEWDLRDSIFFHAGLGVSF
jgi:hypothetical protein